MDSIRVNTGAKRIEVNDSGDYITLNFGDASFYDRFFDMVDHITEKTSRAVPEEEEINRKFEKGSEAHARTSLKLYRKVHEEVMEEVDNFFGAGTCRKVFGDIVPSIEAYDDFFQLLMPYFKKFGEERKKRLSKYSAARSGNV